LAASGRGLIQAAAGLSVLRENRQREDVANAVATSDFTARELEIRNEVGPDGAGYQDRVTEEYEAFVDEQAENIEDDETREEFRRRMLLQRNQVSSRSAQYEFKVAAVHSETQANDALSALNNKIMLDADGYDTFVAQGIDVINARPNLTQTAKAKMTQAWQQASARARFDGMLEDVSTPEELDAIEAELRGAGGRDWTDELKPADTKSLLSTIGSARKTIATLADTQARAAIERLSARANDPTVIIPRDELAAASELVVRSKNPVTVARFARIERDQEIVRQMRAAPLAAQREMVNASKPGRLPPRLHGAVQSASSTFGVSSSYLAQNAQSEYGSHLKGEEVDYGKGHDTGASSAMGVGQWLKASFVEEVAHPALRSAILEGTGIDVYSLPTDEVLALRANPEISMLATAHFAMRNGRVIEQQFGRKATDSELYMMHFFGQGDGPRFLRAMQNDPDAPAASITPNAAKSNKNVFYDKNGNARTVREVHARLGRNHQGGQTYNAYEDQRTHERIAAETETRVNSDPMQFAMDVGVAQLSDVFEEGGMAARGADAQSVADYYDIPLDQMKPFTKSEAEALTKQLADADADEALSIIAAVQDLGALAQPAMAQISDEHTVYGYAGGLAAEGHASAASEVMRGQKRIEENASVLRETGATEGDLALAFTNATGGALMGVSPSQRQSVQDAALAHYVETHVARGGFGKFNQDAFETSVNAVLGGANGTPIVDDVNGKPTILPAGLTGDDLNSAFEIMTVADWTNMSATGHPPRYITGEVADPEDLADEATLQAIGRDQYRVQVADGTFLVTGDVNEAGRLQAYIFAPTAEAVQSATARAAALSEAETAVEHVSDETEEGTDGVGYTYDQWRSMSRSEREKAGLPVSEIGGQWAFRNRGNTRKGVFSD
jgi:hypothetical protein